MNEKTTNIVKNLLMTKPICRDDDFILYMNTIQAYNPELLKESFAYVMTNAKDLKLPAFATVIRTRRDLQCRYESLQSSKEVKEIRDTARDAYHDYYVQKP